MQWTYAAEMLMRNLHVESCRLQHLHRRLRGLRMVMVVKGVSPENHRRARDGSSGAIAAAEPFLKGVRRERRKLALRRDIGHFTRQFFDARRMRQQVRNLREECRHP